MTNGFQPDKGTMEEHLRQLFHWTSTNYKFEIRCLHPTKDEYHKPKSRVFEVGQWSHAVHFAETANQQGYNVYVTVNPLKHSTVIFAKDADVAEARWQFIDIDSLRSPEDLIAASDFPPSMMVVTGTEPTTRLHLYWPMSGAVDFITWTKTQKGLAAAFGSDKSIINPSRIMRLAGTFSYPDRTKAAKGYKPEQVTIEVSPLIEITPEAFQVRYPEPIQSAPATTPKTSDPPASVEMDGDVPLEVVRQALNAVPPIVGDGQRKEWLALAMSVKAANPAAKAIFDQWQRMSPQYERSDDYVWNTVHPVAGSYLKLFAEARAHDPEWWRDGNPIVADWWRQHIEVVFGSITTLTPMDRLRRRSRWMLSKKLCRGVSR